MYFEAYYNASVAQWLNATLDLQVVELRLELAERRELARGRRVLGRHLRRALLVVPEAGLLHLLLERAYARL